MRCVFLALVMLPAAIAYSSGSASTYASGSASTYTSAKASAKASAAAASSAAAPAQKTIQVVKATLKLPGVSASAFDETTPEGKKLRTAFKNSVALGLKICGTSGTSQCSGTDVVITGVTRRRGDATVSFYVKTASKTAASSGATALSNYVSQGTTFVDNLKKEAAAQGVTAAVANVQKPVFTVPPKADTQSVPTPTPTVSGAGKTAVAAGVTVALAGLSMLW
jgi:hypothetical protein